MNSPRLINRCRTTTAGRGKGPRQRAAKPIGKFSYSNVSYVMLGAIVDVKTGPVLGRGHRAGYFYTAAHDHGRVWSAQHPRQSVTTLGHVTANDKLKPVQSSE